MSLMGSSPGWKLVRKESLSLSDMSTETSKLKKMECNSQELWDNQKSIIYV